VVSSTTSRQPRKKTLARKWMVSRPFYLGLAVVSIEQYVVSSIGLSRLEECSSWIILLHALKCTDSV
jgi:hypothetical protein